MKRGSFDQPVPIDTETKQKPPLEAGGATIAKNISRDLPQTAEQIERAERENQDSGIADPDLGLFGVADGMGGNEGGAVASRLAFKALEKVVRQEREKRSGEPLTKDEREALLRKAFDVAQSHVDEVGRKNASLLEMGTTLSAFLVDRTPEGKREVSFAHVGDSRIYHYDAKKGQLNVKSKDDSISQVLVDAGLISEEAAVLLDQSQEKGGNVLRALKAMRSAGDLETLGSVQNLKQKAEALARANPSATSRHVLQVAHSLAEREALLQHAGKPPLSVPEMIFAMRNIIFKAVRVGVKETPQIGTFEVGDEDIVFGASDGLGDVLTVEDMEEMIKRGLKEGKPWEEIAQQLAATAKADKSNREKKGGDDIRIEGVMVHADQEEQKMEGAPSPVEVFSTEQIADWQRARKEYQEALRNVTAVTESQARLRQELELLGENFDNPDFSQLALLDADKVPHKKEYLERAYVKPGGYSHQNLEKAMRAAKVWASHVMASSGGALRSFDDVLTKYGASTRRKRELYDRRGTDLQEYERIAAEREPLAQQAEVMLLRAKAENLDLLEEGDEVTFSPAKGFAESRYRVKKSKGELALILQEGESPVVYINLREEDPGASKVAPVVQAALRQEAERREADLVRSQREKAKKSAK